MFCNATEVLTSSLNRTTRPAPASRRRRAGLRRTWSGAVAVPPVLVDLLGLAAAGPVLVMHGLRRRGRRKAAA